MSLIQFNEPIWQHLSWYSASSQHPEIDYDARLDSTRAPRSTVTSKIAQQWKADVDAATMIHPSATTAATANDGTRHTNVIVAAQNYDEPYGTVIVTAH